MQIGVPAETSAGETRVAVTPETAKKLKAQGHTVRVQSGAGLAASVTDDAYVAAGAEITQEGIRGHGQGRRGPMKAKAMAWLGRLLPGACAAVVLLRTLAIFSATPFIAAAGADSRELALSAALAYAVSQAALQVPWGRAARRFPPGRVLIAGLVLFAAGLLLQAAATTWTQLLLARVIQGSAAVTGVAVTVLVRSASRRWWTACLALSGLGPGISMLVCVALRELVPPGWGLPEVSLTWAWSCLALCLVLTARAAPAVQAAQVPRLPLPVSHLAWVLCWNAAGIVALTFTLAATPAAGWWAAAAGATFAAAWRAFARAAGPAAAAPDPGRMSAVTLAQALGVALGCGFCMVSPA